MQKIADQYVQQMVKPFQGLLSCLKAQHWNYWSTHWVIPNNYGDHLLFERLYNSTLGEIDTLAEKLVGIFGVESVDQATIVNLSAKYTALWVSHPDPFERGLASEFTLAQMIESLVDGELTLGMDDFIRGMASDHETNIYLLKQRLGA